MEYSHEFPDGEKFIHTLRQYLSGKGTHKLAALLAGATCDFTSTGDYVQGRWNVMSCEINLYVPVQRLSSFTRDVCRDIAEAADIIMPTSSGYEISWANVSALLTAPSPVEAQIGLNVASTVSLGTVEHDGLRFRSYTETLIYDELKRQHVLFFPNPSAVLGKTNSKREPDFVICCSGRWGILEVMGDDYHPPETAPQEHDRARLFNDYGVTCIWFYSADKCMQSPREVVADFLRRLAAS